MFRKPRDVTDSPVDTTPIRPSTGRPPTPPHSVVSKTQPSMDSVHTAAISTPPPLLGRSKTAPRTNGRSPGVAGPRSSGKSNGSILSFFKKVTVSQGTSSTDEKDAGLFLEDPDHEWDGTGPMQTPSPPGDFDDLLDLQTTGSNHDEAEDFSRYNESGGSIKRRRLSANNGEEKAVSETRPLHNMVRRGPFVDESDDEDDEPKPLEVKTNPGPTGIQPLPDREEHSHALLAHEEMDQVRESPSTDEPPSMSLSTPILKREPTSHADEPELEDLEEYIDDEYTEGEEYLERRWMEEQAELEMGLEDGDDSDMKSMPSTEPKAELEALKGEQKETVASCPICGGGFRGLSEQDTSKHVNDCLDGRAQPLPTVETFIKSGKQVDSKPAVPNHKRFQRAAIARPGQDNPFDLAGASVGGSSAFSKLMTGHAEDAAWATAAATEAASRGKPAYQRTCPFYKILPGFSICVDAFRYGAVEGCKAYFLSHFHSDHYIGLTSSWCHGPIYCSRVTANLVRRQLRVDPKWVIDLEFEQKVEVPGTGGVHVTMIAANHCPGSSLYLYEKVVGKGKNPKVQRVLHCGDFRACPAHVQHPLLRPDVIDKVTGKSTAQQKLDVCYLDTTYLTPKYAFPSQEEVIKACADMCVSLSKDQLEESDDWEQMKKERAGSGMVKFVKMESQTVKEEPDDDNDSKALMANSSKRRGRLLVIVGTYSIGKERICVGVAKALQSKIYATPNKQKICAALEDPELTALLTSDPLEAQVHMQMLMEIRAETLVDYLTGYKPHFSRIVGFRPSGWNYRPPNSRFTESPAVQTVLHSDNWKSRYSMAELVPQRGSTREAQCFGVPYSEHSSFRELTMFCCALRIDKIIPTVNVGSAKSRERMKGWCDRWAVEKKKNGLFRVKDGQVAWS